MIFAVKPNDEPTTKPTAFLQLSSVTKSYTAEEPPVLQAVTLGIQQGESLAVTGPSGSGKSTLLNLMGALDHPTSGAVLLDGRDLSNMNDDELARFRNREIGFVFQVHHLLPQCTVLENVLIPTLVAAHGKAAHGKGSAEYEARARQLLERVGMTHRLSHRPGALSGGECQRVAVVRALINEPRLLLADEPTGSLDQGSAENLAQLVVELNEEQGVALVVVTHSTELAERMSRQLRLSSGKLQELAT